MLFVIRDSEAAQVMLLCDRWRKGWTSHVYYVLVTEMLAKSCWCVICDREAGQLCSYVICGENSAQVMLLYYMWQRAGQVILSCFMWQRGWTNHAVLFYETERLDKSFCYAKCDRETGHVMLLRYIMWQWRWTSHIVMLNVTERLDKLCYYVICDREAGQRGASPLQIDEWSLSLRWSSVCFISRRFAYQALSYDSIWLVTYYITRH